MGLNVRTRLELPRTGIHPEESKKFVPSLERDPKHIASIRELPVGSKVLLAQTLGLWMIASQIKEARSPAELQFVSQLAALSVISGGRHNFDQAIQLSKNPEREDVARNDADLLPVASTYHETWLSPADIHEVAIEAGQLAVDDSLEILTNHVEGDRGNQANALFRLGRRITNFGGVLAVMGASQNQRAGGAYDVQLSVRNDVAAAVAAIPGTAETFGRYASPAMYVEPHGRMTNFMAENAPRDVFDTHMELLDGALAKKAYLFQ